MVRLPAACSPRRRAARRTQGGTQTTRKPGLPLAGGSQVRPVKRGKPYITHLNDRNRFRILRTTSHSTNSYRPCIVPDKSLAGLYAGRPILPRSRRLHGAAPAGYRSLSTRL